MKLASLIIPVAATATVISCDSATNNSPESDNKSTLSSIKTKSKEEITQLIDDLKTSKLKLTDLLEFKNESFNEEIDKLTTVQTVEAFVTNAKNYITGLKNAAGSDQTLNEAISTKIGELKTLISQTKQQKNNFSAIIDAVGKIQKDVISKISTTVSDVDASLSKATTAISDAISSIETDITEVTSYASDIILKIDSDLTKTDRDTITSSINSLKNEAISSIQAATSTQAADDLKTSSEASMLQEMIGDYKPIIKKYVDDLFNVKASSVTDAKTLADLTFSVTTFDAALSVFATSNIIGSIDTVNTALDAVKQALI